MADRFTFHEADLLSGQGRRDAEMKRTSLGCLRGKKKRRMEEQEEKRRIRGDSHWSKLLQVNTDTNGLRHKRCIRMCRRFSLTDHSGCRLGLNINSKGHSSVHSRSEKVGESGIIATVSARIRQWLQSKRKYEVSPVNEAAGSDRQELCGKTDGDGSIAGNLRADSSREDCLVITQVNNCHPDLKRTEAIKTYDHSTGALKSLTTVSPIGRTFGQTSPTFRQERDLQNTTPKQIPIVDISIELVDQPLPHEPRTHFLANPLKLNQNQAPKAAIMTPATRVLSRSQQLRQSRNKYMKLLQRAGQLSPGRSPLTGTISAPAKHGVGEKGSPPALKRRHIKTWPLPSRKQLRADDDDPLLGDSEMDLPFMQEMGNNYDRFGIRSKSSLKDFSISFKDLNLGEMSKKGRGCKIYKGRWHGDVMVHVFGKLRQKDKDAFWANLNKLCRIRHENIILFMAACTSQPNLAVVTGHPQGKSLYEYIHLQKEKTTMHTKIAVLRQIALGMGYLHAKGIVLRKLNTKNIFIGHRVKVSAMDFGFPDVAHDREHYGSIPRGHLTYIAPEIMSTIRVVPPRLVPFSAYSPETDVFAFGTIMYEVLTGMFPYTGLFPESIIWQVCAGHRQVLHSLKCSTAIKTLIEDCWAHEPFYRPEFRELCKDLQRHSPLHKKHSSSEPERLNKSHDLFDL